MNKNHHLLLKITPILLLALVITGCLPKNTINNQQSQETTANSDEKLAQQTVTDYLNATLGTLPSAQVNYDKAKNLSTLEFGAGFDNPIFVPTSYGIQDGPDKVVITKTEIESSDMITIYVDGYWSGEVMKTWIFMLEKEGETWKVSGLSWEE